MPLLNPTRLRSLLHEPLLRFTAVGLAIFALNAFMSASTSEATDEIIIQQSAIDQWRLQYKTSNGRLPSEAETQATITQWVDEELLYRQAIKLGLHQNDSIVRRQLIQKMNFVIEGAEPLPAASDDELQAFLDDNIDPYRQAEKVSFQQVFFSRGSLHNIRAILDNLQTEPENYAGQGDSFVLGQSIHNADTQLLRKHFGKRFVDSIDDLPADQQWVGPISSGLGLHLLRINKRIQPQPPLLAEVRKQVALDYRLQQEQQQRRKTLDQWRAFYNVQIRGDDE